ncbi:MAG: 16S rRNA (guanine(966)-N(2))-methyltransferase RsmD [Cyanobacteria bacterium SZAS-4]|nr:16S rRNA (guanine(966)-N(2))-methyltransferase RsmD [Cyanobacteria bacterium SZAS-4]
MRITGGEARGRLVPSPEGLAVRPTASKIRQAFFNILQGKVGQCDFLDVFAGTGLMGLEALSRGANSLVSIEAERRMARALEDSLKALGFDGEVICGDYRHILSTLPPLKFDIVFADPPYKTNYPNGVVEMVELHDLLKSEGILAIEHKRDFRFDQPKGSLKVYDRRQYGQTAISFFRMQSGEADILR